MEQAPHAPVSRAAGLAALAAAGLAAAHLTPPPTAELARHPTLSAAAGTLLVFVWLVAAPGTRWHRDRWEHWLMAGFLGLMPVVYINSLLVTRAGLAPAVAGRAPDGPGWLWVELAALPVFVGLAAVGARRAPWVLGLGILAHGLLWDAWHIGRTAFMPDWYAAACLLVDVGWGLWALSRARAWATQGG